MLGIDLDLRKHCIETATKRSYNRLLSVLFRSKEGDSESEEKLYLLQKALRDSAINKKTIFLCRTFFLQNNMITMDVDKPDRFLLIHLFHHPKQFRYHTTQDRNPMPRSLVCCFLFWKERLLYLFKSPIGVFCSRFALLQLTQWHKHALYSLFYILCIFL